MILMAAKKKEYICDVCGWNARKESKAKNPGRALSGHKLKHRKKAEVYSEAPEATVYEHSLANCKHGPGPMTCTRNGYTKSVEVCGSCAYWEPKAS